MGTSDHRPQPSLDNAPNQPNGSEKLLGKGDTLAHQSIFEGEAVAVDGTTNAASGPGIESLADNDVLAAITAVTPDTVASIEHALDQLTSTTDLFDVPALDFDSGTGS
jgi:hypothetical protein